MKSEHQKRNLLADFPWSQWSMLSRGVGEANKSGGAIPSAPVCEADYKRQDAEDGSPPGRPEMHIDAGASAGGGNARVWPS